MGKKSEKWKLTNCCQRCILQLLNSIRFYFRTRFAFESIGRRDCVSIVSFSQKYSQSLPETVMKCWPPLGDPCACTTATCAVTCWPFWLWPFEDGSATRICESLESEDSSGTTSMTLTLPEGAVCRIIFFCRRRSDYAIVIGGRNYGLSDFYLTEVHVMQGDGRNLRSSLSLRAGAGLRRRASVGLVVRHRRYRYEVPGRC